MIGHKTVLAVGTALALTACTGKKDARDAERFLRQQVSSVVVEPAPFNEPWCAGSDACFAYRGVDTTGQLQQGGIKWQYIVR